MNISSLPSTSITSQMSFFYLAEGGLGGTHSTVGQCTQVPDIGPYTGEIHTIHLTDYSIVVLFSLTEAWVVHKGMNNYLPSPINGETGNIWEWWCNSGKC